MKHRFFRMLAICLVVALLLCGCNSSVFSNLFHQFGYLISGDSFVPFSQMQYQRPDMTAFRMSLQACTDSAATETDAEKLMDTVYAFYEQYYNFYTNYSLANIRYYQNMTDIYWDEEYNYCMEKSSEVDAAYDKVLYALADSRLKGELESEDFFGAGFFDDYSGDSIWDDTFTEMMEKEAQLQSQYYEISAAALSVDPYSDEFYDTYGQQMAEVFVEMVALRQDIAEHLGYDNYPEFAYSFYFSRDYTPQQAVTYTDSIRQELAPLYNQIPNSVWQPYYAQWTEEQTFSYVETCANAMGGTVKDAFALLKEGGYYDISVSENKYDASFEVFLTSYNVPFVFVGAQGNGKDPLSFTHEFGHFCNDYAAGGTSVGIDVAEVFSQGLEYLSLIYGTDTEKLEQMEMAESLCVFVEQSAFASFEHQVYDLEEEELTVENVQELFGQIGRDFGFGHHWDSRSFVHIMHFFVAPMYVISYVVSNDAAMQIYQAELETSGAGLKLYEENLTTQEEYFLAFVKSAGLKSPFEKGRVAQLRKTFETILG